MQASFMERMDQRGVVATVLKEDISDLGNFFMNGI